MDKLISVIIPAYNIEAYIERCLDSIVGQTYENLEVIIVDDGSTDRTGELLDQYKENDHRIKVFHKKNGGVSSARNFGLDVAHGDYIGFVDGDDVIEKDMFQMLIELMEQEQVDIAHCGYKMVFPDRVDDYYNTRKKKIQSHTEGLEDLLSGQMIEPAVYNKLYKSRLFEHVRFDENLKINEDLKVNYLLFRQAQKSVYYDVPKYSYMIRGNSATGSNTLIKKNQDTLQVFQYIYHDCNNEKLKQIIYQRYIYLLMAICRTENRDKDFVKFQKESKIELKKEMKTKRYHGIEDKKLKRMVFLVIRVRCLFRFIYWLYDKKYMVSKKYSVD